MSRLHVVVEGQTEEAFANRLLVPHLSTFGVYPAIQLTAGNRNSHSRRYKGGWNSYNQIRQQLVRWARSDQADDVWFTTMLDLYALPTDFPGIANAFQIADPHARVSSLECAFRDDMAQNGVTQFIPYLQLHEFEALILSDPRQLEWEFLEHDRPIRELVAMAATFVSPEHINSTPEGAPSKRIIASIPEYEGRKTSAGPLIAEKIGLASLRQRCSHFDAWMSQLELLGGK